MTQTEKPTLLFHNCKQFKEAGREEWYTPEDWDIRKYPNKEKWEIVVNEEYGIYIDYCPFCGKCLAEFEAVRDAQH